MNARNNSRSSTRHLNYSVKAAILGAIGYILMFIEFPLPIFPGFLKLDFGEVTSIVAGFALGPLYGVMAVLVKNLLHLLQTSTAGSGELANICVGSAMVLTSSLIYHRTKTRKGALIGLVAGTVAMIIVGVIVNYLIVLPFYSTIMPMESIYNMASAINPRVNGMTTLLLYVFAPFNLIKGLLLSIIVFLIYKKISRLLHG